MITKRIIPCLDVRSGRVVKGTNFEGIRDVADPVEMARMYNAAGADELVFYDITASSDERAARRLKELEASGRDEGKTLEQLKAEIEARDYTDSHREFAPLTRVSDAILVDTTDMTIEQAVKTVTDRVKAVYYNEAGGKD